MIEFGSVARLPCLSRGSLESAFADHTKPVTEQVAEAKGLAMQAFGWV